MPKKIEISKEEIVDMHSKYITGEIVIGVKEGFNGYKYACIMNWFHKNNLPMRPRSERSRRYTLNEHYFDKIETEEQAYILGWLLSDGNMFKNTISLPLQERDKKILEKINVLMGSDRPLGFTKTSEKYPNRQDQYCARWDSNVLCEGLRQYEMRPKKSLILRFPEALECKFYKHFIRGYFEGDGSISATPANNGKNLSWCYFILGTEQLLMRVKEIIKKETGIECGFYKKSDSNVFELRTGKHKSIEIIMEWMYSGATIWLDRKYEKFQQLKQYIVNAETKEIPEWWAEFFKEYRKTKSIGRSAEKVGINRTTPYSIKKQDERFKKLWEENII